MAFVVRYPKKLPQGKRHEALLMNIDIPAFILDYAQVPIPEQMQGQSFRALLEGSSQKEREYTYYRYWEHSPNRPAHFGIRSKDYKLIYYYGEALDMRNATKQNTPPSWEFYDLNADPKERINAFSNPEYREEIMVMHEALKKQKAYYQDQQTEVPELELEN